MDSPVEPPSGHPYDPDLAARVSRLEGDMRDMRTTMEGVQQSLAEVTAGLNGMDKSLTRIDAQFEMALPMIARIQARLDEALPEISKINATLPHLATKADLSEKPSKTYMWGVLAVLLTAYACGLAALAILR